MYNCYKNNVCRISHLKLHYKHKCDHIPFLRYLIEIVICEIKLRLARFFVSIAFYFYPMARQHYMSCYRSRSVAVSAFRVVSLQPNLMSGYRTLLPTTDTWRCNPLSLSATIYSNCLCAGEQLFETRPWSVQGFNISVHRLAYSLEDSCFCFKLMNRSRRWRWIWLSEETN